MTQQQVIETYSEPGTDYNAHEKVMETRPSLDVESPVIFLVGSDCYDDELISRILKKMNEAVEATAELESIPGLHDRLQASVESGPGVSWRSLDLE